MVNMQMFLSSPDLSTPHGGPPFQGWRKGFGFGHSAGPGGYMHDPSMVMQLRCSPKYDRCLASSPFWRKKWELGQANSFGIGDRPDQGRPADADVGPNTYGDYSAQVSKVKRNYIRPGIKMKPRFDSFEEKKKASSVHGGPGPAKYNTSIPPGQSSWSYPSRNPRWSLGPRTIGVQDKEGFGKPGPDAYNCITQPGKNSPVLRGTLYDIAIKSRTKVHKLGEASPGPARYTVPGELEKYGLDAKIANVKVPKSSIFDQGEDSLDRLSRVDSSPL
ncbi:unnamed protein product [Effrenium voratum]|uniref:Uncharacterized protein n=1 Tax=Effrenium voratum TaxID=2562239 RepID=A0AA36IYT5_9DINO|nr:unnamed protein product [Effrenium voratum]CAJ1396101.1 unnamed protein product [Effrenium voratum]CAJ1421458.1 unnamed protein product [Effrenium voratum]